MNNTRELNNTSVRTNEVIGVDVKNAKREDLGVIEEIVLDKVNGQVRYVVLSFGGIFKMGNKLFALPWEAISYDEDDNCFILDYPKQKLENAPGFDKDNWPNLSDAAWGKEIYNYYGKSPYWD